MLGKKRIFKLAIAPALFLVMLFLGTQDSQAQKEITIHGTILSENLGEPVNGASVTVEGTERYVVSDIEGKFAISVNSFESKIIITNVGYESQTVFVSEKERNIIIRLKPSEGLLENVVVVGYGTQDKKSVVGAITQTTGDVLERSGGVNNLGMALTGNLPGVVTMSSSGMPGAEDPQILIRAQTSWNSSAPLILVDGVERSMSDVDISSVETVSVLKDASATAVFGVRGANGVILITTKQGVKGKANIRIRANMTTKVASKLPAKYDSYDALNLKNQTILEELMVNPTGWLSYKPQDIIEKYRFPESMEERDRYPNVDWEKEIFKSSTQSYNTSVNVSGGSDFVRYFTSVDFVSEGDLFRTFQNNRGYQPGYAYTRINVRSNLNFNLTRTTKLDMKIFGSNGVRKVPWGAADSDNQFWSSVYRTPPDALWPIYSDGNWGYYAPAIADIPNSVRNIALSGIERKTSNQITSDFSLDQDLGMLINGLSVKGRVSLDYGFQETGRGINDLYHEAQSKWVDPETGTVFYQFNTDVGTQLDFSEGIKWTNQAGSINTGATSRRINYSFQVNYGNSFGKNNITAMGIVLRDKFARGSEFAHFREDWVFRTTYNYDYRYLFEANGAYNGSEKFGPDFRFAFFPSLSAGWVISREKIVRDNIPFLDNLKIRASWGRIGDDNAGGRFLYHDQWSFGGNTIMGSPPVNTPYTYYRITTLGNPNISWETVEKRNLGVDYGFLKGKVTGSLDIFRDHRTRIIIGGGSRAIPTYFGVSAPSANLGEVVGKGYEAEINLNQTLKNGIHFWISANMTHAKNRVIFRDDPQLLPAYQKAEGYSLGQTKAFLDHGYLASWDDIYGSTQRSTNNINKLPGYYNIIDFNGDGVIDSYDRTAYQYPSSPQNTYNTSLGMDWKGWNIFIQFYGVNNVTREVQFPSFHHNSNIAYEEGTYWTVGEGGDIPFPQAFITVGNDAMGTRYFYDGSYVRLKNAEIGYTLRSKLLNDWGFKSCKIYVNGDNLILWTKMPDDRESNFSGNASFGAYPTMRRFNVGIEINL